jgi:hypothetical protein
VGKLEADLMHVEMLMDVCVVGVLVFMLNVVVVVVVIVLVLYVVDVRVGVRTVPMGVLMGMDVICLRVFGQRFSSGIGS